jgi:high-affinity Fe2+/Pb2+ permease
MKITGSWLSTASYSLRDFLVITPLSLGVSAIIWYLFWKIFNTGTGIFFYLLLGFYGTTGAIAAVAFLCCVVGLLMFRKRSKPARA